MPRGRKTTNTANPENETKKKTKRRKKTVETPVEAAPAVENAATDAVVNVPVEVAEAPAPKKRGRKPKETGPALITTLLIGDIEFDISGIAEKAYKEYKRVHKRKVVTDFRVYVKPEEGAAYYTVNGEGSEDFKVDLT
jgi:hypothetical protein